MSPEDALPRTFDHLVQKPRLDIPRVKSGWEKGKPLIIPPGGGRPEKYYRASSFGAVLEDTSNLTKWKMRQAVTGICVREDLRIAAGAVLDDRDALNAVVEKALAAAGSDAASDRGTELHAYAEAFCLGQPISDMHVPPELLPTVEGYARHMDALNKAWGMEPVDCESFVVLDDLRVSGSFDFLWFFPDAVEIVVPHRLKKGKPWVIQIPARSFAIDDNKTGSLDWSMVKYAIQEASYANGERYDPEDGSRSPLGKFISRMTSIPRPFDLPVNLDVAFITHMCPGEPVTTHPVDIVGGLRAAYEALQVRDTRRDGKDWVGQAIPLTAASRVAPPTPPKIHPPDEPKEFPYGGGPAAPVAPPQPPSIPRPPQVPSPPAAAPAAPAVVPPAVPQPPAPPRPVVDPAVDAVPAREWVNELVQVITAATTQQELEALWASRHAELEAEPGLLTHLRLRHAELAPPAEHCPGTCKRTGWTRNGNGQYVCSECRLPSKANAVPLDAQIANASEAELQALWPRVESDPELVELVNARYLLIKGGLVS